MTAKPVTRKAKAPTKKTPKGASSVTGAGSRKAKTTGKAKTKRNPKTEAQHEAQEVAQSDDGKNGLRVDLVQARADFVRFYIEQDFQSATGAYRRAYPKANEATAAVEACRLLKDPKVQEALSDELSALLAEKRRPLEKRILDTWLIRAFYDPTEIISLNGSLKISEAELRKKGLQVCIDSINRKLNAQGMPYLEYKLADRDKALDMLRQYIQMIEVPKQKVELSGDISIGLPPPPEEAPGA
jgi:hypothetical protein